MDRGQILEMRKSGMDIGSHTLTHPHLPLLSSSEKWQEIQGSKAYLEDLLGFETSFFCYPYGEYDDESVRLAQDAGYKGACCNHPGANKVINPFRLSRVEIAHQDTLDDFKKKLAGAFDLLHKGLHWVRGRP